MDTAGTNAGAFFVFVKTGSKFEQKQVIYPSRTTYAYCGDAVMFRGDYLIVSCQRAQVGTFTNAGTVEVYRYNAAKRATAPFEWVQSLTPPTLMSTTYSGAAVGMNDEGTRISFSSRAVSYTGQVVFFQLVNDKFVFEGTIDGTVTYSYFGEAAQYPVRMYGCMRAGVFSTCFVRARPTASSAQSKMTRCSAMVGDWICSRLPSQRCLLKRCCFACKHSKHLMCVSVHVLSPLTSCLAGSLLLFFSVAFFFTQIGLANKGLIEAISSNNPMSMMQSHRTNHNPVEGVAESGCTTSPCHMSSLYS
jgi:hypothetical protein